MTICIKSYVFLMNEDCLEFRMRSRTSRGVSKWSRGKDSYVGRLYSDIGMVPSDSGILSEYRGVTGIRWGKLMGLLGHSGGEEADHGRRRPPLPNPNWTRGGGAAPLFPSPSLSLPLSPSVGKKEGG